MSDNDIRPKTGTDADARGETPNAVREGDRALLDAESDTRTEPPNPVREGDRALFRALADTRTAAPNPVREGDRALFRAHAVARLRGDTPEALRLALQIGEGKRMAHLLYVLYLFTQTVYDELGDAPDPWDLADLTRRLHERHYRPGGGFWAIRAEAMVRGVCGDSVLMTEVPVAEQPTYMWAVIGELVGPDATDAQIAETLDKAEAIGVEIARAGWNSMFTDLPAPRPAPETGSTLEPDSAQEPGSAPEAAVPALDNDTRDDQSGTGDEAGDRTDSGDRTGDSTSDRSGDRTDMQADEEETEA